MSYPDETIRKVIGMPVKGDSGREVISVTLSDTGTMVTVKGKFGEVTQIQPTYLSKMELVKACGKLFTRPEDKRPWIQIENAELVKALESGIVPEQREWKFKDPNAPASPSQLNLIRSLALQCGVTANPVTTIAEAHAEIERLKRLRAEGHSDETPKVEPTPSPVPVPSSADLYPLTAEIEALKGKVTALTNIVSDLRPQVHEIHVPDKPKVTLEGRQHPAFPDLLEMIGAGLNVFLVGPAGTGKSYMVEQAAQAMGIPFSYDACAPDMDSTAIFGYRDGNGQFQETLYFRAFTDGGWHNFDEGDKLNGAIATGLNNSIANGSAGFGGQMFKRHPDNIITVCANTFGTGGTKAHIHSLPLDIATLNRFTFLYVGYDEALENEITMAIHNDPVTETWLRLVRTYRANAESENFTKLAFSYRDSMAGASLLRIGWDFDKVKRVRLDAALSRDEVMKLSAGFVR